MEHNRFKIDMWIGDEERPHILKTVEETIDGKTKRYIQGVASGINDDLDGERMARTAIEAFRKAIKGGMILEDGQWSYIQLREAHGRDYMNIIGWVVDANIDNEYNLIIKAELDNDNPKAMGLWRKLTTTPEQGKVIPKLGMSVGGTVKAVDYEWNETFSDYQRVFKDIDLDEISVTSQPANPKTYVEALTKSVNWTKVKKRPHEEEVLTKGMIMENENQAEVTEEVVEKTTEETVTEEIVAKTEDVVEETTIEEVAKSEEVEVEDIVEKSTEETPTTDQKLEGIVSSLTALTAAFEGLTKSFTQNQASHVEVDEPSVEVEKAEETSTEDEVQKSKTETSVDEVLKSLNLESIVMAALEKALPSIVKPLEDRMVALESQEVDKAFSVEMPNAVRKSAIETIEEELAKGEAKDSIKNALRLAAKVGQ